MIWLKHPYVSFSICIVFFNLVTGQGFLELFNDIKFKTKKFLDPSQTTLERLSSVVDYNGHIVYSNNQTEVVFEEINSRNVTRIEGSLIDLTTFKQPDDYFLIHLGTIDKSWNVDEFNDFTTILDNTKKMTKAWNTLFGFTLSFTSNQTMKNLPYVKASIRDLKQYMIFKNMEHVSMGIEIDKNDSIPMMSNVVDYFHCDNKYAPNFYFAEGKLIDINHDNSSSFIAMNKSCSNIFLNGINPNFIPYSPRASRCDCIMAMLKCVVDQGTDFSFANDETLLNEICSSVHCGSILNEPEKGNYGVFASCNNIQKYSIAFNLYYTLHNNEEAFCNFDHKAKVLKKEGSVNDYLKLLDFDGKQCNEEIMEDWNKYLIGISKTVGDNNKPGREKVYNYDVEFKTDANNNDGHSDFRNSSANGKIISLTILIWLLIKNLL
ncbi:hypothetical protein PICMEDRAFT_71127 [Pichia membranifaciens NRRL Y-2026]|uniref:1,3-beta-glucanosyltransferase n=1 Tax=Pichia membranifaciens NRRL Y-2026 TaxID=763406 RepID=A0A1E3NTW6_9ASCO|nr:hypothetical protein PICMEDRAFT_71127 [Pichia membranifaciens NRRL Y-2026]ODQ49585.1 hypothetical protein PICMEDRAFT_71127 [Pichia membranifaciens NRRL Y-2026]